MNDNPENAKNGGPESSPKSEKDLCETWRKRAQNNRKIARNYSIGVGVLFIGAGAIVVLADWITRETVGYTHQTAVEVLEWQTLPRRFDFRGAALDRRSGTVFAVGDDGSILAADSGSGLREWKALPSNTDKDFHGIAVSDDGGVVIAAGRRGLVRRSVDRGQTWTDSGIVAAQDVNAVALSGDGGTAILVGDDGLVRYSANGGATWVDPDIVVQDGKGRPEDVNAVALSRNGGIAILVGDDGFVRHSVDGGRTWTDLGIVRTKKDINAIALSDDGKVAVLVGDDGLAGILRMAATGRVTWKSCATNVGDDLNAVALSRDSATAVAAGDDGLVLVLTSSDCNVRGGNVGTPHRLHALVLDEDEDEDSDEAIIVGRNRTIVRLDVSASPFKGGPVGGPRVSKPLEEEPRDPETVVDLSWNILLYSTGLRAGIIVILILWAGHLAGLIRYRLRLAAYYDARADAIAFGLPYLERAVGTLSPDDIGFSDVKVRLGGLLTLLRTAK